MEIKTYERVKQTRHAIKVEAIEIGNDVFAVRYTEETTSGRSKKSHVQVFDCIANSSQIKKLRAGQRGAGRADFLVLTDEQVAGIRQFGYFYAAKNHYALLKEVDGRSVFDHIANGGSPDNLVRVDSYDNSFWRVDGTIFPYGIRFDYIDARMHNVFYDLEKVVEVLRKRDDVAILAAHERYDVPYARKHAIVEQAIVAQPGEEIDDVPYYNRDAGRTHTITFFWTPTAEQHMAIREQQAIFKGSKIVRRGGKSKHQLIFDEDWLGLRAGGAALYGDFYASPTVECDTED